MHSIYLYSVPQTLIEQYWDNPNQDLFELIAACDTVYQTSFEHCAFEHSQFLADHDLDYFMSHPQLTQLRSCESCIIYPKYVKSSFAWSYNRVDLDELERKAHAALGEKYDAAQLMQIVRERLVPLANYAADRDHYIVVDYG